MEQVKLAKIVDPGRKFDTLKAYLNYLIEEEPEIEEGQVVFVMEKDELTAIITRRRLELLDIISEQKPATVKGLAALAKREVSAVDRDLKILERYSIVKLERKGREVMPTVVKKAIVLPLIGPKPLKAAIG